MSKFYHPSRSSEEHHPTREERRHCPNSISEEQMPDVRTLDEFVDSAYNSADRLYVARKSCQRTQKCERHRRQRRNEQRGLNQKMMRPRHLKAEQVRPKEVRQRTSSRQNRGRSTHKANRRCQGRIWPNKAKLESGSLSESSSSKDEENILSEPRHMLNRRSSMARLRSRHSGHSLLTEPNTTSGVEHIS